MFILRSVAGFLLCCMLLHTTGFYIVLQVHKFQMRKATRQLLLKDPSSSFLTRFTFSQEEFEQLEWEEDDEFLLDGHMYDVVSKKMEDNHWQITCLKDEKEKSLAQLYHQHLEKDGPKKLKRSIPLWSWIYLPSETGIILESTFTSCSYKLMSNYFLPHYYPDTIKPPPQSLYA